MPEMTPLLTSVERLADRVRALPQHRLQQGAAVEVLALARELSVRAQRLEFPAQEPREMPDAGIFVVADQLLVAGHDLVEARQASSSDAAQCAAEVALVEATAKRCGC